MDLHAAKGKLYSVKAAVYGYTDVKVKVKKATNLDKTGPSTSEMQAIVDEWGNMENRSIILRALWKRIRLSDSKEWRHVYKTLVVIEYIITHGPENAASEFMTGMVILEGLRDFGFVDARGVDHGTSVRNRAKVVIELLKDEDARMEARRKVKGMAGRIEGFSVGGSSSGANKAAASARAVGSEASVVGWTPGSAGLRGGAAGGDGDARLGEFGSLSPASPSRRGGRSARTGGSTGGGVVEQVEGVGGVDLEEQKAIMAAIESARIRAAADTAPAPPGVPQGTPSTDTAAKAAPSTHASSITAGGTAASSRPSFPSGGPSASTPPAASAPSTTAAATSSSAAPAADPATASAPATTTDVLDDLFDAAPAPAAVPPAGGAEV